MIFVLFYRVLPSFFFFSDQKSMITLSQLHFARLLISPSHTTSLFLKLFFVFWRSVIKWSFNGFYCNFDGLLLGFTRFYWVLSSSTGFSLQVYGVLLGFTEFYWDILGFTWFYWVLLGFMGLYLVLLGMKWMAMMTELLKDVIILS